MIKERKNGFTLAELLIVVAIIAVLVSIAIPIFANFTETSKESVDLSNIRNAYSELMLAVNDGNKNPSGNISYTDGVWSTTINLTQEKAGWQSDTPINIGGVESDENGDSHTSTDGNGWTNSWIGMPTAGGMCTISVSSTNKEKTIAWSLNFYDVLHSAVITNSSNANYNNKTIDQLLTTGGFSMIDSSGQTGRYFTDSIKKLVGMSKSSDFSYTIIKPNNNKNQYNLYISTDATLKTSGAKTGRTIKVTGYVYDSDTKKILKIGEETEITTYAKDGREKMNYTEYKFN